MTGFVGPESKPVPLTEAEVEVMMNSQPQAEATKLVVGEEVRILSGPLENFTGVVEALDGARQAAGEGQDVPEPGNAGGDRSRPGRKGLIRAT